MCDHDTVEVEATPQTIRNNDGIIKRAISSTTGHLRNRGAKLESPLFLSSFSCFVLNKHVNYKWEYESMKFRSLGMQNMVHSSLILYKKLLTWMGSQQISYHFFVQILYT